MSTVSAKKDEKNQTKGEEPTPGHMTLHMSGEKNPGDTPEACIAATKIFEAIDDWSFNSFALAEVTKKPLKYMGTYMFNRHGFIKEFKIDRETLDRFLTKIEHGYGNYDNLYHNALHATDVAHSVHYVLNSTGLEKWLTPLETFAILLGAIIHDFDHSGKTNKFLVYTNEDRALLYNDRSVQENHHISASFFILRDNKTNILSNLSSADFRYLRSLIIDMILSTDMAYHFQIQKDMKNRISTPSVPVEKSKVLSHVLHTCDLASTAKSWEIHKRFATMLLDEFFKQGDLERELGMPISPLCDRNDTLIPESQIHFIDFIVEPTFAMCCDMLLHVLQTEDGKKVVFKKPWEAYMLENKRQWRVQSSKARPRTSSH